MSAAPASDVRAPTPNLQALTALLQLEQEAREAQSLAALQFLMVNETKRLVPYRQAWLLARRGSGYRALAASSVAVVNREGPLVSWLEASARAIATSAGGLGAGPAADPNVPRRVDAEALADADLRTHWTEFSLPYVLWCPLRLADGTDIGALWLASEQPWTDSHVTLAMRVCATYAHAWLALAGRRGLTPVDTRTRRLVWAGAAVALLLLMFVPVRLSTLAPAEVVPREPLVISAPIDGVVAGIPPDPNTPVTAGQVILQFDDTELRNALRINEEALRVSVAELRKASQGAFSDAESNAMVGLLRAQVALSTAERDFSRELLGKSTVSAPRAGLLLYTDRNEWIGRPVMVGERIMQLADPDDIELRIDLPVSDAIALNDGARVRVFLDADPLRALDAHITHTSYAAEVLPGDLLSYRLRATFDDPSQLPDGGQADGAVRIGLKGTAKVYGESVTLGFYLFRRPLSALRQMTGW